MQVVVLAAGKSSRLYPFNTYHKSLISIMGEPIISHTLKSIKKSGIRDVIIVTGENNFFESFFGNGRRLGLKITYVVQKNPTGMGDALLLASKYIKSDFFLIHPHRVEFNELKEDIDIKRGTNKNAVLLAKKEERISSYGSLVTRDDQVLGLVEKPKNQNAPSNLKVVGMYFLNQDFISELKSAKPHEYSFETAIDQFAKKRRVLAVVSVKDTVTLKYPWDLLSLKNFLFKKLKKKISKNAKIEKDVKITGQVVIEDGAVISENAVIKGPSYIGRNTFIGTNSLVRDFSDLEEGAVVGAYMEVKNSLISKSSSTHSGFIGDSVMGKNCKIGALFGVANKRLDRENVKVKIDSVKVDSGLKALGTMIGDNVICGNRVSVMPGVIIGNNVNIGPSTTVFENIPTDTVYYTKFQEIIKINKRPSKI